MAKSKNHTAHNQTRKAHRNGIKKPKAGRFTSLKGVRFVWLLVGWGSDPLSLGAASVAAMVRLDSLYIYYCEWNLFFFWRGGMVPRCCADRPFAVNPDLD